MSRHFSRMCQFRIEGRLNLEYDDDVGDDKWGTMVQIIRLKDAKTCCLCELGGESYADCDG